MDSQLVGDCKECCCGPEGKNTRLRAWTISHPQSAFARSEAWRRRWGIGGGKDAQKAPWIWVMDIEKIINDSKQEGHSLKLSGLCSGTKKESAFSEFTSSSVPSSEGQRKKAADSLYVRDFVLECNIVYPLWLVIVA